MSRFPAVSETFILQEILEMERQGVPVEVFPLIRQQESTVHPEAAGLVGRAHYVRLLSPGTIGAQIHWLRRSPRRYSRAWHVALSGNLRSPRFLVRALVVVPIAARFARRMERLGVVHQHAHWATHPTLAALVVRELTDIPYSFTAHAHDIYVNRTMLDAKIRSARFVATISDFNARLLREWYGPLTDGKIEVIRCGIDLAAFPRRSAEPPRGDGVRLLCVAGLRDYKGHIHLLRAVASLRRVGVPVTLDLVGDGPLGDDLRAASVDLGVDDHVVFHGALTGPEVARAMDIAHLFVLPSIITRSGKMEGLPVALMEAMARGLPTIATAISAIPELVVDGETGLLVPPADPEALARAIRRLAEDPALAGRLAAAGAERARRMHDIRLTAAALRVRIAREHAPVREGAAS